jgi:hypothetical protein
MTRYSRRSVLAAASGLASVGLAGCLGVMDDAASADDGSGDRAAADGTGSGTGGGESSGIPLREQSLHVPDAYDALRADVVGGGPGKDGIPSVDDPTFESIDDAQDRLFEDMVVFVVAVDGDVRAYPQYILVWHEIVNDVVGDVPLAVTYCPLTGTVLAFERGSVEFGVSGKLVNSNLVMYDRETDSRWPQVLGTAIDGDLTDRSLEQRPASWTTWKQFTDAFPDGVVLTEDTGHVRDYGRDPYGSYTPRSGYYLSDTFAFEPRRTSDRRPPKAIVHGVRTPDGAFAVDDDHLASERVVTGTAGSTSVVVVFDTVLETAVAYANPEQRAVEPDPQGEGYRIGANAGDDDSYPGTDLPLERLSSFDAMFFAWYAFYPDSEFALGENASTTRWMP